MPVTVLSESDKRFIRKNVLLLPSRPMAEAIGCSRSAIQRLIKIEGIKPGPEVIERFRIQAMIGRTTFTKKQDAFIKKHYLTMAIKPLAEKIGRSFTGVMSRIKHMGLVIPDSIIEERKSKGMFKKGIVPVNKGKKQIEFMSAASIKRTKATRFKKGSLPKNTLHDGAVVSRHCKSHKKRNNKPYKWIRISQAKWEMLHVYNWQKVNGPVPKDHIIVFADGDTMNCEVSNLNCITRAQHCANTRNTDGYIAKTLSLKKGGKGIVDRELFEGILKTPSLLNLKRHQLKLKHVIDEHQPTQ